LVERPFAVVGVPSGRREAGSEKDELSQGKRFSRKVRASSRISSRPDS
jgi:hypothetical protein